VDSGNFNPGNGLNNQSNNGYYWSATTGASTWSYNLNFDTSTVNPANTANKWNGLTVRCVAAS
jgi:hypothetical protein